MSERDFIGSCSKNRSNALASVVKQGTRSTSFGVGALRVRPAASHGVSPRCVSARSAGAAAHGVKVDPHEVTVSPGRMSKLCEGVLAV